jgi:hypothetical protein
VALPSVEAGESLALVVAVEDSAPDLLVMSSGCCSLTWGFQPGLKAVKKVFEMGLPWEKARLDGIGLRGLWNSDGPLCSGTLRSALMAVAPAEDDILDFCGK